jgi:hypothetical protein
VELSFWAEVKEKPHLQASSPQVAEQLPVAGLCEIVRRLHLHDNRAIDQEIETLKANDLSLEMDRYMNLALDPVTLSPEHPNERLDVDLFKEAVTKIVVHLIKGTNDRLGEPSVNELDTVLCGHDPQDPQDQSDPRNRTVSRRTIFPDYGEVLSGFFLAAGNSTLFRMSR